MLELPVASAAPEVMVALPSLTLAAAAVLARVAVSISTSSIAVMSIVWSDVAVLPEALPVASLPPVLATPVPSLTTSAVWMPGRAPRPESPKLAVPAMRIADDRDADVLGVALFTQQALQQSLHRQSAPRLALAAFNS